MIPIPGLIGNTGFLENNSDQCQLLGNFFGYFLQLSLGLAAFSALIVKLYLESPRRPFKIWFFDTSKQASTAILGHLFNIYFSDMLTSGRGGGESPCPYYMGNFLIDSFVGCLLYLSLLKLVEVIAEMNNYPTLAQTGNYGPNDDPKWSIWGVQMFAWIMIMIVAKLVLMFSIILPFKEGLYSLGESALFFTTGPKEELLVVMVIIPVIVNALVFLFTDLFLKGFTDDEAKSFGKEYVFVPEQSQDTDPLMQDEDKCV